MIRPSARCLAATMLCGARQQLLAQGAAHYVGGAMNIRDVLVPAPGSYLELYSYFYSSSRLADRNGGNITSFVVTTPGGQSVPVRVNVDVFMTAQLPMFLWVSPWKILGGKYAAMSRQS